MQTNFSPEQLRDARLAEAESILRRCVHCGLCTATCPTYVLLGDERDSPRGRIYLMKDMFEGGRPASEAVTTHIDRCLSCLSCMTTCPSGVDYMHLVDLARAHIQETRRRPWKDRLVRRLLGWTLPWPRRFRLALRAAALARPFGPVLRAVGLKEVASMLDLAPRGSLGGGRIVEAGTARARGQRRKRVALLTGCAQQVLRPQINEATIRVLTRHGADVVVAPGQQCCGALVHHMGHEAAAQDAARINVDAWSAAMRQEPLDAIIVNTSGCGTVVKDYGHLLGRDQGYAGRAEQVAGLTRDITEFLHEIGLRPPRRWSSLKVAYHSACSMQHGQRISVAPRALLTQAGYTVLEVPEGHLCCGSAGTYNILQPAIADRLRARKIDNIASVNPDVVATGNIGCIMQLQGASAIPVVHTIELIDWSLGGPCPKELEVVSDRVRSVDSFIEDAAAQVGS